VLATAGSGVSAVARATVAGRRPNDLKQRRDADVGLVGARGIAPPPTTFRSRCGSPSLQGLATWSAARRDGRPARPGRATDREVGMVAAVLAAGSEKAAANRHGLSHQTVKHHLANAWSVGGVATTEQLVRILPRIGWSIATMRWPSAARATGRPPRWSLTCLRTGRRETGPVSEPGGGHRSVVRLPVRAATQRARDGTNLPPGDPSVTREGVTGQRMSRWAPKTSRAALVRSPGDRRRRGRLHRTRRLRRGGPPWRFRPG
jgi:DNA-binding CsgD family transcriptional regulator